MRYRVKDYTVDVYQGNARVFLTVPSTLIEAYPSFTQEEERKVTEAIRLIIDETAGVVFCSSMQKDNIIQMQAQNNQDGTTEIAICFTIPSGKTIASTDQFTIEFDWGDSLADLRGCNGEITLTSIYEYLAGQTPEDIPEGLGDRINLLLQFFGLPQALPEYTALTTAEAIAIARDCQYNVMGTDWPIPTWLPTGVTEAQVESAAEGLGIPYHEPTQTA